VSGARLILPVALALVLIGGAVEAGDQPTATEPVSGSFDHEPSQTGTAAAEAAAGQAESATSEGHGEGEPASINPKTLALQLLNFGVLIYLLFRACGGTRTIPRGRRWYQTLGFILVHFGGELLTRALRSRHDQLKADIEGAADRRAAAEQRFREQDSRLANLERELTALRAEVQQTSERERARLLDGAQEKAKRIQEETRFQLDQQVREAEQRLRAEVASTAVKVADELLRRSVGPEDERRLAQDFAAAAGTPAGVVR
jgi:F0F1-type ATP synthase membrane subunit b/b'